MKDTALAVQYCWSLGIAHCDLSPRNFIWYPSMDQPVKLVDFGLAVWYKKEKAFKGGSVGYYPPEQIVESEPHEKSDVFGLGCLFCSFYCTKRLPWKVPPRSVDTLKTFDENYRKKTDLELKDVNKPEKNLLKKMLAVYPDNRPNWDVILREITTAESGEQCQDMSKQALEMMEGSSIKPRPQQAVQPETEAMDTTNPLEADDEGTSMEDDLAQEENEFTREHYKESLAAEQRTHQHQDRVFNDQMQGLGNASRIDSKKSETIKWVMEEIDETVESAKRRIEIASNKDEAKQVAKRMRNDVTQTGKSGKDEIAKCLKDEIKIIEDEVTGLVEEAHEKINDLAVSVSQNLPPVSFIERT